MLGIRQRLLISRLRAAPLDWLPVTGRDVPAAHALARRGLIEYRPAHGEARALPEGPRSWPAAGLMRAAQWVPDRPA